MKARIFAILLFFLGTSQIGLSQLTDEKQNQFAEKFIESVTTHNHNKLFKLLDKSYRKEQLKFLNGNKQQLIDELFGGSEINSDIYVSLELKEIESIEIEQVIMLKGNEGFTYLFKIKANDRTILCSLLLQKKGNKYGFIGAVG